ncbi:MAG TPA: hypothetical protein VER08_11820 [Pyrinomonadaceae bacterium]|nr:hypothetical protein [Pyrinomonadaceae bacterium]
MSNEPAREWVKETVAALYDSEYAREHVAMENYLTLPFPRLRDAAQQVVFSFCLKDAPMGGNNVYPPFLTAAVGYPEREISWREVGPEDYGLARSPQEPLGPLDDLGRLLLELTPRGYRELRGRYYELLSVVLRERWLLGDGGTKPGEREAAREVGQLLDKISEAALGDYYRAVGRDLRAWLARASAA